MVAHGNNCVSYSTDGALQQPPVRYVSNNYGVREDRRSSLWEVRAKRWTPFAFLSALRANLSEGLGHSGRGRRKGLFAPTIDMSYAHNIHTEFIGLRSCESLLFSVLNKFIRTESRQPQWPRGLRRTPVTARLLELRLRILPGGGGGTNVCLLLSIVCCHIRGAVNF